MTEPDGAPSAPEPAVEDEPDAGLGCLGWAVLLGGGALAIWMALHVLLGPGALVTHAVECFKEECYVGRGARDPERGAWAFVWGTVWVAAALTLSAPVGLLLKRRVVELTGGPPGIVLAANTLLWTAVSFLLFQLGRWAC